MHATEPEDIGQDIVFLTNPAEEEFSQSEVTAKGGDKVQPTQTASPVKQVPMEAQSPTLAYDKEPLLMVDLYQSVTPPSEHQDVLPTDDALELIGKASYPESYQPAPKENLHTDREESHVFATTSPKADYVETIGEDSTLPTTDATTAESGDTPEHYGSVTESLHIPVLNATSESNAEELLSGSPVVPQEGDLPVLQEDHTPHVHFEHGSETELIKQSTFHDISGQPEKASTVEEIPVLTASPHNEEADVQSTTLVPSFDNSTPQESGEKSANPPLNEDAQTSVTQGLMGVDTSATSKPIPTSASGESQVKMTQKILFERFLHCYQNSKQNDW